MDHKWTEANTAEARAFWQSETGRMMWERLNQGMPDIRGTTVDEAAIEGSKVAGYRHCLRNIEIVWKMETAVDRRSPFLGAQEE